jgi:methylase of polypeptide subunit release factors
MEFYRSIVSQGPSYLRRGGSLLLEVGEDQGKRVSAVIEEEGSFVGLSKSKTFQELTE